MAPLTAAPEPDLRKSAQLISLPQRARRRGGVKGRTFPPDPLFAEDVALLMNHCVPQGPQEVHKLTAARLKALIAVLYRTGLRISEALDLIESDLDRDRQTILVRTGKGGKRRIAVMDEWGWRELDLWMSERRHLPVGSVFCVLRGATAGGRWSSADVRRQMRELQQRSGIRKRVACHQFRHALAVELFFHEGQNVLAIQRQLGHANLTVTERYLRSINTLDLLEPIARRKPPMIAISNPSPVGDRRRSS